MLIRDLGLKDCILFLPPTLLCTPSSPLPPPTAADLDRIIAPPNQYVVLGQNTTLQCVFTDPNTLYGISFASIKRNSQAIGQITNASLEDEGVYQCDVTLFSHSASALIDFTLHIFSKCIYIQQSVLICNREITKISHACTIITPLSPSLQPLSLSQSTHQTTRSSLESRKQPSLSHSLVERLRTSPQCGTTME